MLKGSVAWEQCQWCGFLSRWRCHVRDFSTAVNIGISGHILGIRGLPGDSQVSTVIIIPFLFNSLRYVQNIWSSQMWLNGPTGGIPRESGGKSLQLVRPPVVMWTLVNKSPVRYLRTINHSDIGVMFTNLDILGVSHCFWPIYIKPKFQGIYPQFIWPN